jgi:hypothetical protein
MSEDAGNYNKPLKLREPEPSWLARIGRRLIKLTQRKEEAKQKLN